MSLQDKYCILSVEKVKTANVLRGKFNHNFRLYDILNSNDEKRCLNEMIIGNHEAAESFEMSLPDVMQKTHENKYHDFWDDVQVKKAEVESYGRKVRKDAVLAIELVLTYSSAGVGTELDLESWKAKNADWLKAYFGEENVVSAVLHMDETTPHIHAVIIPIDRTDGKPSFNSKRWLGGKNRMAQMQSSYAEAMSELGLKRGEKNSRAKHTDIKDYYRALNATINKETPKRENYATIEEYTSAVEELLRTQRLKLFALEKKLERVEAIERTREHNDSIYRHLTEKAITEHKKRIEQLTEECQSLRENDRILSILKEEAAYDYALESKIRTASESVTEKRLEIDK